MKTPIKYALIYLLIGSSWIILSDLFLLSRNEEIEISFVNSEIWKGLGFVFVTSLLVYILLLKSTKRLAKENNRIRQHETLLEQIIDNNKDDYALLSAENEILYTNDSKTQSLDDFLNWIQLPQEEHPSLKSLIKRARQEMMEMEREYLAPDHSRFSNMIVIPLAGNNEVLIIHRDLTNTRSQEKENKTNQQILDLILLSNDIGIWEWDLVRSVYSSNAAFKKVIGLNADDVSPSNAEWIARIHDEDRQMVSHSYAAHLSGETEIHKSAYRFYSYKNIWKWLLDYSLVTERDENGEPTKIIGVILDIDHDEKNKEMIKNQGKIIQQMAFANSHHVRGPVARIQGLIQLMEAMGQEKPLTEEECKDILGKIKTCSEDLDRALNDFALILNS